MATISREALQWLEDERDSDQETIAELEEELSEALEEVATLKAQIQFMMSDRSVAI